MPSIRLSFNPCSARKLIFLIDRKVFWYTYYNQCKDYMPVRPAYFKNLYQIAESQEGYFTAKQALASGYSNRMQTYHVQNGDWIKETRGIFRLDAFPPATKPELIVWYLWSFNRQGEPLGVYSHETALSVYSLSSWNSKHIHLTVPPGFQRMVVPPIIRLHRRPLRPGDVITKYGVPVTKPLRTIVDLLVAEQIPRKYLKEAILEALDQELFLPGEIQKAKLSAKERQLLERSLKEFVH
jgi:hypothetical protein